MNYPGNRCKYRVSEWQAAICICGMGVWTIFWPGSFADGRFAAVDNLFTVPTLTWIFLILGGVRIAALFINGYMPFVGPIFRMIGAVMGAAIFSQLAFALVLNHSAFPELSASPGIVPYVILATGEIYSAYRAAGDARRKPR